MSFGRSLLLKDENFFIQGVFSFCFYFLLSTNADEVCEGESSCYPGVLL